MVDPKKMKESFEKLNYDDKVQKIKVLLDKIVQKFDQKQWEIFFELRWMFDKFEQVSENIIDYMYDLIINIVSKDQENKKQDFAKQNEKMQIKMQKLKEQEEQEKNKSDDILSQL